MDSVNQRKVLTREQLGKGVHTIQGLTTSISPSLPCVIYFIILKQQ